MKTVVCFGEIMGRLAPEQFYRFAQTCPGKLDLTFAGAEANVAASISLLGGQSAFVSALPQHAIADACLRNLRGLGVKTEHVLRVAEGRLGLYFVEAGANQRASKVIYDRDNASVSLTSGESYPWATIFQDAGWLHLSGITPALSAQAAEATKLAAVKAKEQGLTVSCDLNFRKKLWRWEAGTAPRELAQKTMRALLSHVDVVVGNEEDAADVLGIHAEGSDVGSGVLSIDKYPQVAAAIAAQFSNLKKIAITLRESLSASHNNWGAMLYDTATQTAHFAPNDKEGQYQPYEIRNMVDRVGGGDSFAAGLIFALSSGEFPEARDAIAFAAAASCLAHSIKGDFNYNDRSEIETLMGGNASGRVVR